LAVQRDASAVELRDLSPPQRSMEEQQQQELDIAYAEWKDQQIERELEKRFPGELLEKKILEIIEQRRKSDHYFTRVKREQHPILARQILRKEFREQVELPSFEQWCKINSQGNLFTS